MIHIDKTSGQTLYIPCNGVKDPSGAYALSLQSEEYGIVNRYNVVDASSGEQYFVVVIDATSLNTGEYSYTLGKDDHTFETGLLVVGDYDSGVVQYDPYDDYIQYDPEDGTSQTVGGVRLADIERTYTDNGEHMLVAPEGFDGIRQARIDVFVEEAPIQEMELTLSGAGTYVITPEEGFAGISKLILHIE